MLFRSHTEQSVIPSTNTCRDLQHHNNPRPSPVEYTIRPNRGVLFRFEPAMRLSIPLGSCLAMTSIWTRALAWNVAKRFTVRPACSKLFMTTSTTPDAATTSLRGMVFVQDAVVHVLNNLFDPAEVAKNNALAKLEKPKKQKKQKKNENQDQEQVSSDNELSMSEEEKQRIADAAAASAKPFDTFDSMVTTATKMEFGDYQINAAMGLAKSVGMSPR